MTARERRVLHVALGLTVRQRARLASELLASLVRDRPAGADPLPAEVERRARRALAGQSRGRAWPAVRARIEKTKSGR